MKVSKEYHRQWMRWKRGRGEHPADLGMTNKFRHQQIIANVVMLCIVCKKEFVPYKTVGRRQKTCASRECKKTLMKERSLANYHRHREEYNARRHKTPELTRLLADKRPNYQQICLKNYYFKHLKAGKTQKEAFQLAEQDWKAQNEILVWT